MHKWKRRTQKERWGSGLGQRSFWVPALGPGPFSARTRVLCMHKSVVHAQESSRILYMHNTPFYSYIIINIALKHSHTRDLIFSFIYTYTVD